MAEPAQSPPASTGDAALAVPHDMLRGGSNFVLRVRGDSMRDEQIRDGDYIIVTSRQTAEDGEMVVALIHGETSTVRKFYRERDGRVRLQPSDPASHPTYLGRDEVQIHGVVVGVIRKY
ncbi:MAG: S24 family peptidase [Gemmatimonadota bacterium]